MEYIHENAKLNAIRNYKIIPVSKLQEAENVGLSRLYELLKEYKYTKILSLKEAEIDLFKSVEESVMFELQETIILITKFLRSKDKWIIQLLKFFYIDNLQLTNNEMFNFDLQRIIKFKSFLLKIEEARNKHIKTLLRTLIDFENIKIFLSYRTISEIENVEQIQFLDGGNLKTKNFVKIFPDVEMLKKEVNKIYPKIDFADTTNFYLVMENEIKKIFFRYKNYFFTIEPLLIYFFEKFFEVQKIKNIFIKFAK